jgi:ribosomal-protein-alanine N-acetyltransferase
MYNSKDNYLFGIFFGGKHVGNIKLGSINHMYRRGDIGLIISKEYWGRGIATAAIRLTEDFAFNRLGLHKVFAGVYAANKASLNAFLRNGWDVAGEYKDHCIDIDGNYINCFVVEKINSAD